jgi:putative flippase GtrA
MKIEKQVLLFVLVGALNTLVGYSFYAFFIFVGLSYQWAVLFSTCLGILFNFKTLGVIVFNNKEKRVFLKFLIVYTLLCLFNMLLIQVGKQMLDNLYLVGFFAIIPSAMIAFISNKLWVFRGTR